MPLDCGVFCYMEVWLSSYYVTKILKPFGLRIPLFCFGEPAGARTQDPILKRDVLYLLSY